jgi:hypothetical protein
MSLLKLITIYERNSNGFMLCEREQERPGVIKKVLIYDCLYNLT